MPAIFLVEDNAGDVELFRLALQDACVECDLLLFEDGREIIDYILKPDSTASRSIPDLIILDLNLPKNDGVEVLQVIRNATSYAKVSIVVLSSSFSTRERANLETFQIREFILKPSEIEEYLNIGKIVRNLLHESTAQAGAPRDNGD